MRRVALIGNPNCGKSTLFNRLTGLNQKTSNLPGTTVDSHEGKVKINNEWFELVDLPGIYSLFTNSEYEHVVVSNLTGKNIPKPDAIIYVLDSSNLRRNLLLLSQVAELKIPAVCVLTMEDTAARRDIKINAAELNKVLGIPVISLNPRISKDLKPIELLFYKFTEGTLISDNPDMHEKLTRFLNGEPNRGISTETLNRYSNIDLIVKRVVIRENKKREGNTLKIDKWVTHPISGFLIFFGIMLAIFQGVFSLAEYPMTLIEHSFSWLRSQTSGFTSNEYIIDFINSGLLSGLEGVIVFLPQIFILFFLIGILEDSGYMVRASFLSDQLMRKLGLNGRSIIPLIGGFACAIPAIMATRTIRNRSERLATMLVVPLMSCSARIPVYILLISLIVPAGVLWGPIPAQTLLMTLAYFAGIIMALILAVFFKMLGKSKEQSEFVLELPTYQAPRIQTVINGAWLRCKSFLNEAGKIIVIISMVLWALSSFGPDKAMKEAYNKAQIAAEKNPDNIEQIKQSYLLEASYAGHLGKMIEPVIEPLGYDWKTGIALISSFAAREVFVGTMSTLFQTGANNENVVGIRKKMQAEINPTTGKPAYGIGYAVSLMLFYAFALQCISTMAVLKKETQTWKWSIILFFLYGSIAYLSAFAAFQFIGNA